MRQLVCRVTIKDCQVQTFRVSGAGGQHRDKTSAGVRVVHPPSGAVGKCTEHRSQHANKRTAFVRMAETPEFERWANMQAGSAAASDDAWLKDQLRPENLLIEYGHATHEQHNQNL